ncbi:MAG: DUF1648 domain-containing protein [Eubacteriales bacterium]|nr:DUF1648 domain-containing protein [Eubacteriales bacterium]
MRTKRHTVLEMLAWLLLLASYGIAIYGMRHLPESIATHYALDGAPDGYGSPGSLLILPIIITIALGIVSLVAHFVPVDMLNVPFEMQEKNQTQVYQTIISMLHALQIEIGAYTLYMTIMSYRQDGRYAILSLVIFLAVLGATTVGATVRAYHINQQ